MREVLAVLSAPRAVDYLPDLLASCEGPAGPWRGEKLLVCDGVGRIAPVGWKVKQTLVRLGSVRAFASLLREAGDADLLLVVHDDVKLARGALPYMRALGVPRGLAAVVYYQEGWHDSLDGLHERQFGGRFVGAICIAYSKAALEKLRAFDWEGWAVPCGLDAAVSRALAGEQFAVHVPHLAQHVGVEPAIERALPLGERPSLAWSAEAPRGQLIRYQCSERLQPAPLFVARLGLDRSERHG